MLSCGSCRVGFVFERFTSHKRLTLHHCIRLEFTDPPILTNFIWLFEDTMPSDLRSVYQPKHRRELLR